MVPGLSLQYIESLSFTPYVAYVARSLHDSSLENNNNTINTSDARPGY